MVSKTNIYNHYYVLCNKLLYTQKKKSFQRNLFGTRLERQFLKFYMKTSEINKRMPEMISAGRNPGEFL